MAVHAPIIAGAACAPGIVPESAPTRRDLMRAMAPAAAAIVPATAVAAKSDASTAWDRAYTPVRDAYRAYERDRAALCAKLNYDAIEAEKERLEDIWFEAEAQLVKVPAPNAAALASKVLILVQEGFTLSDFQTEALRADAERLGRTD